MIRAYSLLIFTRTLVLFPGVLLVLGLFSCTKIPDREEQLERSIYINTLLVGGKPLEGIKLFRMDGAYSLLPAENLQVTVETPDGIFGLLESNPGHYVDTSALVFTYNDSEVHLLAKGQELSFHAITTIPPANNWTTPLPPSMVIQSENPWNLLFFPQWTLQQGLEYIAILDFLGNPLDPVPFNADVPLFNEEYRLPFTSPGIQLYAGYFQFYGQYRLRIYGVPKTYAEVYFSSQLQQSELVADNIIGGTGLFFGANMLEWMFYISPQ